MDPAPMQPDPTAAFRQSIAEKIWLYTQAVELYARSQDRVGAAIGAQAAREAALDLAKDASEEGVAASWIEIAEVWAWRAGQQPSA